MKIYFLRHGKRGHGKEIDILLPEGIGQAKKSAKILKNFKIDKIISGTSKRARDTAKQVTDELHIKIEYTPKVNEKEMGILEGKNAEEWRRAVKKSGLNEGDFRPKGGENWEDFNKRVKDFYERLKKEKVDSILIISHSGFIRQMIGLFLKKTNEELKDINIDFGSISFIKVDEIFNIQDYKINDIYHL